MEGREAESEPCGRFVCMLIEIFDKFAPASGEISFLEACRARSEPRPNKGKFGDRVLHLRHAEEEKRAIARPYPSTFAAPRRR